jgi:hypothetical protein
VAIWPFYLALLDAFMPRVKETHMSIQSLLSVLFPVKAAAVVDPLQQLVDNFEAVQKEWADKTSTVEAEVALLAREQELKSQIRGVKTLGLTNLKSLQSKKEQAIAAIALEDRLNEFVDFCVDSLEVVPPVEINAEIAKLDSIEFQQWMSVVQQCSTEQELLDLVARALI